MIDTQAVVRSLPLVAGVLGKRYGVNVEIGGIQACTDGKTIRLPALPPDGDPTLLSLVRSYIDHESAHIRHTDFSAITAGKVTPLEKHIWNCIEDWRVENALARIYPGCRTNFDWLIEHHFGSQPTDRKGSLLRLIPDYILYTVRSWDVPGLTAIRSRLGASIRRSRPQLLDGIDTILTEVRGDCDNSLSAMAYAQRIVALIGKEAKAQPEPQPGDDQNPKRKLAPSDGPKAGTDSDLQALLNADESVLPQDLGQTLAGELEMAVSGSSPRNCTVATEVVVDTRAIPKKELAEIRKASASSHARLQGLLQARKLERRVPGRHGRLDTHRLHLIRHDPRLFLREGERTAVNTFVHLLLDCSGSMRSRAKLAAQAAYAIASSLHRIDGIRVAVTAFPASAATHAPVASVVSVLLPDQRIHAKFLVKTGGGTPMGEAMWWAMREGIGRKETRKIILVVTDGCPDSQETVRQAVKSGRRLGFEFCGVGICHDGVKDLLPGSSESITDLGDLAPCLFRILQHKLTAGA